MQCAWGWVPLTELLYECLTWTFRSICAPAEGSSQPLRPRWEECLHRWAPPWVQTKGEGMGSDPGSLALSVKGVQVTASHRPLKQKLDWKLSAGEEVKHSPRVRPCSTFLSDFRVKWQDRNSVTFVKLWEFSLVKCSSRGSHVQECPAKVTTGEYLSRTEIWASKTDRTVSL